MTWQQPLANEMADGESESDPDVKEILKSQDPRLPLMIPLMTQ